MDVAALAQHVAEHGGLSNLVEAKPEAVATSAGPLDQLDGDQRGEQSMHCRCRQSQAPGDVGDGQLWLLVAEALQQVGDPLDCSDRRLHEDAMVERSPP